MDEATIQTNEAGLKKQKKQVKHKAEANVGFNQLNKTDVL